MIVPQSTVEDVNIAVAAADRAFLTWSETPPTERAAYMDKIADLIEANLGEN